MAIFYCEHGDCMDGNVHGKRVLIDEAVSVLSSDGSNGERVEAIYDKFVKNIENIGDFRVLLQWAVRVGSHVEDLVSLTLSDFKRAGRGNGDDRYGDRDRNDSRYPSWRVILHWFRDFGYGDDRLGAFLPHMSKIVSYPDIVLLGNISAPMLKRLMGMDKSNPACDTLLGYIIVHPNDPFVDAIFDFLLSYYAEDEMASFFAFNWVMQVGTHEDECFNIMVNDAYELLIDYTLCKQLHGEKLRLVEDSLLGHSFKADLVRWASLVGTRLDDILDDLLSTNNLSVYLLADWAVNVGYDMLRVKVYILKHGMLDDCLFAARRILPEHGKVMCDFTEANFYDDLPREYQLGVIL